MSKALPSEYPVWLVKASWRSTAVKIYVKAKDELHAWDRASKQVKKMLGGMACADIQVLGTVENGRVD